MYTRCINLSFPSLYKLFATRLTKCWKKWTKESSPVAVQYFFFSTHLSKQLQYLIVQTNSIKIVLKQFARKLLLRSVCHYLQRLSACHFKAFPSTVVIFIKACSSRVFKNNSTSFGVLAQITLAVYSFVSASLCIKNYQLCLSSSSTTSLVGL